MAVHCHTWPYPLPDLKKGLNDHPFSFVTQGNTGQGTGKNYLVWRRMSNLF
jgi:hypothetical protein